MVFQGVDPKYTEKTFEASKSFFEHSMEKKMEVCTDLVPNEYVGYHPLEHYSRAGRKKKGEFASTAQENITNNYRPLRSFQLGL